MCRKNVITFDTLLSELRQDLEYVMAEQELKPFLALADTVLSLRLEKRWSQSELAHKANVTRLSVSLIESGLANPTIRTLQKLSNAFGTTLKITMNNVHD